MGSFCSQEDTGTDDIPDDKNGSLCDPNSNEGNTSPSVSSPPVSVNQENRKENATQEMLVASSAVGEAQVHKEFKEN
jgi:hypothetical protein